LPIITIQLNIFYGVPEFQAISEYQEKFFSHGPAATVREHGGLNPETIRRFRRFTQIFFRARGADENSPAFQRRVTHANERVPTGRLNGCGIFRRCQLCDIVSQIQPFQEISPK